MAELRWILILLGLLLIAAVYLLGRRRQRPAFERREPRMADKALAGPAHTIDAADDDFDPGGEAWPVDDEQDDWTPPAPVEYPTAARPEVRDDAVGAVDPSERKIISVRVAARSSTRFRGEDIVRLLNEEGLEFGKYGIFHRYHNATGATVFSVASMVEPGAFNLDAIGSEHIPGVTLFLVLPGPRDGVTALDEMLGTAQRLAEQLNGEVLDQSGSTLSRQRAGNLRDEIISFEHHLAVQQRHLPAGKGRRRLL